MKISLKRQYFRRPKVRRQLMYVVVFVGSISHVTFGKKMFFGQSREFCSNDEPSRVMQVQK